MRKARQFTDFRTLDFLIPGDRMDFVDYNPQMRINQI